MVFWPGCVEIMPRFSHHEENREIVEPSGGVVDADETPEEAARRELEEEFQVHCALHCMQWGVVRFCILQLGVAASSNHLSSMFVADNSPPKHAVCRILARLTVQLARS